jgi:uncharacterized membrane protein YhiD involved in acid resistance
MEKQLFSDLLNIVTIYIPLEQMIFNQLIATLVAVLISWVYKKTYTGVIYSKNFSITLILISVVTASVMMVIGSNMALSLGMVGALSIIRFRSAIKDTRDVGYLFWGMSAGLASGTGNHIIAILGTLLTSILMFILHKYLGEQSPYLLIVKGINIPIEELSDIFDNFSHKYKLKMKNSDKSGNELIYEIQIKKKEEDAFINVLKKLSGVRSINLLSHKGELIG